MVGSAESDGGEMRRNGGVPWDGGGENRALCNVPQCQVTAHGAGRTKYTRVAAIYKGSYEGNHVLPARRGRGGRMVAGRPEVRASLWTRACPPGSAIGETELVVKTWALHLCHNLTRHGRVCPCREEGGESYVQGNRMYKEASASQRHVLVEQYAAARVASRGKLRRGGSTQKRGCTKMLAGFPLPLLLPRVPSPAPPQRKRSCSSFTRWEHSRAMLSRIWSVSSSCLMSRRQALSRWA